MTFIQKLSYFIKKKIYFLSLLDTRIFHFKRFNPFILISFLVVFSLIFFITSNLIGKREDGVMIQEFEASHGTVADMWEDHKEGRETSLNPLGLVEALIGAMNHSAALSDDKTEAEKITQFTSKLRDTIHQCMVNDEGTRDLCGPTGLTTEGFVDIVGKRMAGIPSGLSRVDSFNPAAMVGWKKLDQEAVRNLFEEFDADKSGVINFERSNREYT